MDVFWGNSYHSSTVFKLQKRIITIMVGFRDAMERIFQKIKNTTTTVSLLFVINNRQHFKINSDMHNINTRNNLDLHYPQSDLSVYQKGALYTGIKVFNSPIKQCPMTQSNLKWL
jgi:glucose-6-phosphate 1-dehydrogenase